MQVSLNGGNPKFSDCEDKIFNKKKFLSLKWIQQIGDFHQSQTIERADLGPLLESQKMKKDSSNAFQHVN